MTDWQSMLAEGLSMAETARRCGVSPSTIKRRVDRMEVDLSPSRRAQAAAKAERMKAMNAHMQARRQEARRLRMEAVKVRIQAGMGARPTARDLGISERKVYRDMASLGIENIRVAQPQSIAARVGDMKPAEAVEYLIAAYDDLAGALRDIEIEGFDLGLTHAETRVFGILRRHDGRVVSHKALTALLDAHTEADDLQASNLCKVYVSKIRGKLRGTVYRIENVWGCGYRLVVSEDSESAESAWPPPGSRRAGALFLFQGVGFPVSISPITH